MTARLSTLALGFAVCAHRRQKRKYTGEPCVNHRASVARIIAEYTSDSEVIAAGTRGRGRNTPARASQARGRAAARPPGVRERDPIRSAV